MTDTTSLPAELAAEIDVDASPAQVWALVSDLARMSSWSPQVAKTWVRGGRVRLGSTMVNVNKRGPLVWPTRAKVVRFEPQQEIAFRIKDNWTIWSFRLVERDGGTHVVHRREVPDGVAPISTRLVNLALGGTDTFTDELRSGMQQTLERVKAEAEAA